MKLRLMSIAVIAGILLLFTGVGFCQDKVSISEWVDKVGQGSVNWSAGYIEAVGIGAPPDRLIGKAAARPAAVRAATVVAQRNLLEIIQGVQVDSATTVRDSMVDSDVINTQVKGLVKGAQMVGKPDYMSDGTVEVILRIPLYGQLAKIIMVPAMAKPPAPPEPAPAAPAPVAPAPVVTAPVTPAPAAPAPVAYTGMVVDPAEFKPVRQCLLEYLMRTARKFTAPPMLTVNMRSSRE